SDQNESTFVSGSCLQPRDARIRTFLLAAPQCVTLKEAGTRQRSRKRDKSNETKKKKQNKTTLSIEANCFCCCRTTVDWPCEFRFPGCSAPCDNELGESSPAGWRLTPHGLRLIVYYLCLFHYETLHYGEVVPVHRGGYEPLYPSRFILFSGTSIWPLEVPRPDVPGGSSYRSSWCFSRAPIRQEIASTNQLVSCACTTATL
uniref:Uncharacterized protein n=1 Tax=Anopheles atroparvus TaxID=41427 RepID=A0AAG5DVC8_ANOAO